MEPGAVEHGVAARFGAAGPVHRRSAFDGSVGKWARYGRYRVDRCGGGISSQCGARRRDCHGRMIPERNTLVVVVRLVMRSDG
mgnify:FL=1